MPEELSRKEWLERRRKYLGGSDAAAALGISPWCSRLQLCQDKWGELEDKPTEVMERGQLLEPLVLQLYREETKHEVVQGAWMPSAEHPFMAATPDGVDKTIDTVVQCKTSSAWVRHKWGKSGSEDIPDDYEAQGQHEMVVTGSPMNVFAVLFADESTFRGLVYMAKSGISPEDMAKFVNKLRAIPNSKCEFAMYPLERDEKLMAVIIEGERNFWATYVKPKVLPPDASIPEKKTDIIVADTKAASIMEKLRDAQAAEKSAKADVNQWKKQVQALIGENTGISANGLGKSTFKAPSEKVTTDWETVAQKMAPSDEDAYAHYVKKYTETTQPNRVLRSTWVNE